jgi:tetratricopeptide (TPR) repeat protein
MGAFEKAIADYTRVIELRPRDADAYNNRAWAYYRLGDPVRALEDAGKALQIRPFDAYALDTRGHVLEILGQRDEAILNYKMAIRLIPDIESSKEGLKRLGANH